MKYKKWNVAAPKGQVTGRLTGSGLSPLSALVMEARGFETPQQVADFLAREPLHDPFLLKDMDRAVSRLTAALENGETVAVYGDYDVDGITATCLLTHFLRSRGGQVVPYIPNRMEEGYGLNREAVETLAHQGVRVIVTVDCGITAVEEAAYARTLGLDVIITDHHECKETLPAAVAVVDPHRADCTYPFPHLAGVGVALKLALAMTPEEGREEVFRAYADLANLGTVADVMELSGENRTIVMEGLARLADTDRPGLRALMVQAGVEGQKLTASSIGYTLAPRINAAGRMGQVEIAKDLLLTTNPAQGELLAERLCCLNRERQAIESEIYTKCVERLQREGDLPRRAIVLSGEDWHQGVVGIVASRLAERYCCPTFMICLQDGKGKGSCRSFGGFNLFKALESAGELLEGFGGHALAAGFTILEARIPAFAAAMDRAVEEWTGGSELSATLDVDVELPGPEWLTLESVEGLDQLEPYGAGNPKPVLALSGCTVYGLSEVGGGRHLKLRLQSGGVPLDAIFFSATASAAGVTTGDRLDVAFTPQVNEFRGSRSVQLIVKDLRPAPTRMELEEALYEKLRRGENITAAEAAALLPSRTEFANLWRYLNGHAYLGQVEDTARRLCRGVARAFNCRESYMRTMVCLEVLDEHGLVTVEQTTDHLRIQMRETRGKVDLESAQLMRRLRRLAEGEL